MSKFTTIFITALLFLSSSVFAISATEKNEVSAKSKLEPFVQVVNLNANEQALVYKILLAKEQSSMLARQDYKGDNKGFKIATKPLNKKYNRQIKDVIGKDRMKKMNQFYKAQRAANKK